MIANPAETSPHFSIEIASDRMVATLRAGKGIGKLTVEMLLGALTKQRVAITPAVQHAVDQLVAGETLKPGDTVELARGVPPIHEIAPRIEPVRIEAQQGVTQRDRSSIPSVAEGAVIGEVIPAIPGQTGVNVFGETVEFKKARSLDVPIGSNVALSQDGKSVQATTAGLMRMKQGRISVEKTLEVSGNLDFSVGNVDFCGSILIRGNVADLFKVRAREDIYVGGAIEAADIVAGHTLDVHGGIVCRDKGFAAAGLDVHARFISNAVVHAGNDVNVQSEISNSRVCAGGKIIVNAGAIYSAHVTAAGGVCASSIGSPAYAKTLVECGIDDALRKQAEEKLPEIRAALARSRHVQETLGPLMHNARHLTAAQKERATEMLYEADQIQQAANVTLAGIAAHYERYQLISKDAEIEVAGTIWPGSTLRFSDLETTIRSPIKGPVKIAIRIVGGVRTLMAIHQHTHKSQPLELRRVDDTTMRELGDALQEAKALNQSDPTRKHAA